MNIKVKNRTIEWLETSQLNGAFDGHEEESKNFNKCTDQELEYYFVEWFFTDDFIEELDKEELKECYQDEMNERERILNN